jgi:drug/metabolite transporter (DMT)-like permease
VAELSPPTLVFLRTGLASLILVPIALLRADLRPVVQHWRWVVAFAVLEIIVPWVLLASAEQSISSSLAGLLVAGVPLVGATFAVATGGSDRMGPVGLVGLLIGLVGVAAIVGGDIRADNAVALVQMLGVVIGYAVAPAILARRLGGVSSLGVMAMSLLLSAVVYAPVAALEWPASVPSANVIASVVVLGVVCTALAFILFAALIAEIGPVRATVITYVNPAVAAVLGVLVLNETFTLPMGLGFGLVILGSTLATRPPVPLAAREPLLPAGPAMLAVEPDDPVA